MVLMLPKNHFMVYQKALLKNVEFYQLKEKVSPMPFSIEIIRHFTIAMVGILFFTKVRSLKFSFGKKMLLCVAFVVQTTLTLALLTSVFGIGEPFRTVVTIIVTGIIFALILRERIERIMIALTIVFASGFILTSAAAILSFLFLSPFLVSDISGDYVRTVATAIISIAVAVLIRKIKIDFSIIFKRFASGIFLSISGIAIIFYGLITDELSNTSTLLLIAGFVVLGYGIFSWFRRETTIARDENANEIISKKQKAILEEKERDFAILQNVHNYLEYVVHRDDKKLSAMQRAVEKLVMNSEQTDVLEDAMKILKEIKVSKNKDAIERNERIFGGKTLPPTGLIVVDAKFETVSEQAMVKGVDFNLEVDGDVSGFSNVIQEYELTNIIGDLTDNAFNAMQSVGRKINFVVEENAGNYKITSYDNGIAFDPNVLIELGTGRITSRADIGGSGIGFETIFKLIEEYGASLIITEYASETCEFSKNIAVCFNGKSEHIIKSFRFKELKRQKFKTRFIIQNLDD